MTIASTVAHRLVGVVLAGSLICLTGCGFNPSNYAMPGTGVHGPTYRLDVEFESLLSLPAGADVRSGGTKVGSLSSISLTPYSAVAHIDVEKAARFPVGTRAELRQTTVLGDIYIALLPSRPATQTTLLQDGDTIALADTDPGPQIEEILNRIATFVNGGSMTRLQTSIDRLNHILPENPSETKDLAAAMAVDLDDAAARLPDIDRIAAATGQLSQQLHDMREQIGFTFSDVARGRLGRVPYFMTAVLNVVIDVNTLTTGLDWLIPRLPHINTLLEKGVPLLREPSASATEWAGDSAGMTALTQDKLIPFLLGPGVDVRQLTIATDNGDATKDGLVLLRMIGALR
ncbi:MlaD family protein [Nocardia sp. NPDC005366]|uniref:MlaD family protein n=1 Tax=Nocardia sp. NPDC005366 TaxID=3156878 RepID=UPI0033A77B9C